jgi:hypothetical protein
MPASPTRSRAGSRTAAASDRGVGALLRLGAVGAVKRAVAAAGAGHAAGSAAERFAVAVARAIHVRARPQVGDAVSGAGAADDAILAAAEVAGARAGALQVAVGCAGEGAVARRRTDAVVAGALALTVLAVALDVVVVATG